MATEQQRILHFIDSGGVYGAEQVILNLSSQMLQSKRYQPVIGCIVNKVDDQNDLYDAAEKLGVSAIKIPIANALVFRDIPRAAKLIKEKKISLIHSHGYKPSVYGSIIYLFTLIPIIATCHLWFDSLNGPFKTRLMTWIEKHLYRFFPKVIAVSQPIQNILLAHRVRKQKTTIIRNGVELPNTSLFSQEKAKVKAELGVPKDAYCVLNAGRLTRQKAQWTLIESAAALKAEGKSVHFLIVGEGNLKGELEALVTKLRVEDVVSLLGFRSDMDRLLSIADVFALPSLDEGMPIALLEACAAKVPVITTSVGDISKLIVNKQTGLLIDPEDEPALSKAILQVCGDTAMSASMAEKAFIRIEQRYSSSAMCRDYIQVYSDVLSEELHEAG